MCVIICCSLSTISCHKTKTVSFDLFQEIFNIMHWNLMGANNCDKDCTLATIFFHKKVNFLLNQRYTDIIRYYL